jgi:predicted porin
VQLEYTDEEVSVKNNSSRAGVYLDRHIAGGVSGFAKLELGTNLVLNNTSFNPDAFTNPDVSFTTTTTQAVTTRLGFVGLKFPKYGSVAIGKQWGVYYDVGEWTDRFYIFGGLASGVYNTNSDGGSEGTGRAEDAVVYRNTFRSAFYWFARSVQWQLQQLRSECSG